MKALALIPLLAAAATGCDQPTPYDAADALPADAQAPPGLTLEVTDALIGGFMDFRVGDAAPNERVYIVRSTNGIGTGDCIPQIGGQCFGISSPVDLHAQFRANSGGVATERMNVPDIRALDGREVCFQAVALRGANGAASLLSTPRCILAGYDTDGDGTINPRDPCPTGDEFFDWDQDGVADGCDSGAGVPPEYTTEEPEENWADSQFQSRRVISYVPNNPRAIVFFFHGTNGGADLAYSPEVTRVLNTYVRNGFGFAAFDSQNRSTGTFNDTAQPNNNDDFARVRDFRASLIASGDISNNTPVFFMGYSAGASMASYMGHATPTWPVGGQIFHHAAGTSDLYRWPDDIPAAFIAGENDELVDLSLMQQRFNDHRARGFPGRFIRQTPGRLAPTRFAQSPNINVNRSIELFRTVVDAGYFDQGGNWTSNFNDVEGTIDDIVALPDFSPDPPGRGVLRAIAVTHRFNSASVDEEVDFINNNL